MKRPVRRLVPLSLLTTLPITAAWAQDAAEPTEGVRPFLASTSTSFVLDNARIVDGTGAPAREGWSLVIEDGLIAAIGSSA